jgi:hypothetical protein
VDKNIGMVMDLVENKIRKSERTKVDNFVQKRTGLGVMSGFGFTRWIYSGEPDWGRYIVVIHKLKGVEPFVEAISKNSERIIRLDPRIAA